MGTAYMMKIDLDFAFMELTISGNAILVKYSCQNLKKNSIVIKASKEKTEELEYVLQG